MPEKSCIRIPANTLQVTSMTYGFHEGGEDIVFVKKGDHYEVWDAALTTKKEEVAILGKDKIKIGDTYFVRLTDRGEAMPTILEELLFKGTYQQEPGSVVEFTDGGVEKGFGDFSYYQVLIDYADQGMQVDQLLLGKNKENTTNYGFKFINNSLLIYSLKCLDFDSVNNVCPVVAFDKPEYRLKKR